jgi:glycine cleavage system H protein
MRNSTSSLRMIALEEVANRCRFPREALYDLQRLTWYVPEGEGLLRVGILPITVKGWGKVRRIEVKRAGTVVDKDRSLAYVEAQRFLGHVKASFACRIVEANDLLTSEPHIAQIDPYGRGWLARVEPIGDEGPASLKSFEEVREELERTVREKGIVCFREVPDVTIPAIGVECSMALMVLKDQIDQVPVGSVIHLIAEGDESSEQEVMRWSQITGHEIVDFFREGRIVHALIRRKG